MDLTRAQKSRLGLFILAGTLILAATVATLTGMHLGQPRLILTARFTESVSGLERNAPVRYQGLHVGRVERLSIAHDQPAAIEVVLAIDPTVQLFEGTHAQLDQSGLTGLRSVNLTPGDPNLARLADGAQLPTRGSLFGKLADGASAIVTDVHNVTEVLGHMATEENRKKMEHLLSGLDRFVGHLDIFLDAHGDELGMALAQSGNLARSIGRTADEATLTLTSLRHTSEALQQDVHGALTTLTKPLSAITPDQVSQTLDMLRHTGERLGARLSNNESGRAIVAFGGTMDRMGHLVDDVDLAVRAGREDFAKTLSSMRQAAEDLREFSRILAQNPTALVRGHQESE